MNKKLRKEALVDKLLENKTYKQKSLRIKVLRKMLLQQLSIGTLRNLQMVLNVKVQQAIRETENRCLPGLVKYEGYRK